MFNFFKDKFKDESLEDQRKDLERFPKELSHESLIGLDCDVLPGSTGDFGRCLTNPIPVNGPTGEIKYINRLRTNDGGLIFHRLGSNGTIDIFETVSTGGKIWDILYLDMYHPRRSTITPSGYNFSKFHEIFSRFAFGYFTTSFDPDFPFGLSLFIEKDLGGKSLVKKYEEVIKDKSKFVRPLKHIEKLEQIKIEERLA
jgi:hypothetical protein